jgi:outer membrane protein assembly factor BamD
MAKRVFFPTGRAGVVAGLLVAGLALGAAQAQVTGSTTTSTDAQGQTHQTVTVATPISEAKKKKTKLTKEQKEEAKAIKTKEKAIASKDTKKAQAAEKKIDPEAQEAAKLPDKQLYDKAQIAMAKGRFDVARLDLQTLLNTYSDSEYQMRAKLAVADSWYKEGGSAALTQAESEYKDFITFFPNAPEAAEAQMRVGDIYFRQMDRPDRDYAKAVHAEEEYRLMLQQFPDSKLVPQAKQRLREVQEVLATREAEIGAFYATHNNWPATIARYQTVADTYPQYSHMDDVLIALGDSWAAEAKYVRTLNLPASGKEQLERVYDERAANAYRKVVLEHSASLHVEDAKDRLQAMNQPIPTPTPEQVAASEALENSRGQYTLISHAKLLIFHTPDVVATARSGEPTLVDPAPTMGPAVRKEIVDDFKVAFDPNAAKPAAAVAAAPAPADGSAPAPAPASVAAAPLTLSDVPAAGSTGSTTEMTPAMGSGAPGASVGAEIVSPGTSSAPLGSPADTPRSGVDTSLVPKAANGAAPLPPVERPEVAPDAVNDIKPGTEPAAQVGAANGKNKAPEFDKKDESSSKHKKKKGLKKLDPLPQ